jgi:hypothetical protein
VGWARAEGFFWGTLQGGANDINAIQDALAGIGGMTYNGASWVMNNALGTSNPYYNSDDWEWSANAGFYDEGNMHGWNKLLPDIGAEIALVAITLDGTKLASTKVSELPGVAWDGVKSVGTSAWNGVKNTGRSIKNWLKVSPKPSTTLKFSPEKIQHEFKHAKDFGIEGNWNKQNGATFEQVLLNHIKKKNVQSISGTYRGNISVTHYYEPETGLNVMIDTNGNFVGAWKLGLEQIRNLLKGGNIQ